MSVVTEVPETEDAVDVAVEVTETEVAETEVAEIEVAETEVAETEGAETEVAAEVAETEVAAEVAETSMTICSGELKKKVKLSSYFFRYEYVKK